MSSHTLTEFNLEINACLVTYEKIEALTDFDVDFEYRQRKSYDEYFIEKHQKLIHVTLANIIEVSKEWEVKIRNKDLILTANH